MSTSEPLRRKIRSVKAYKRLMRRYFFKLKAAPYMGKKVAWITSGGPVEFLRAMRVIPFYPENHGAMCGASRMSVELCEAAENQGYSPDLCSYARCDIGASLTSRSPIGRLPEPDFLVCCNNICGTVLKWFQIQSRCYNAPLFFIDTPFINDEPEKHALRYVKQQMEEYINFLEGQLKRSFDTHRFERVVRLSAQGIQLWKEILELNVNHPAPMTSFDAFVHIAPIVTLRGTREAVNYYKKLKQEMEERVARNTGAILHERYRLIWDNIPIWYEMRNLSRMLASYGIALVADTYTSAWALNSVDPSNPLESLVRAYATVYLNRGLSHRVNHIIWLLEKYSADGFIMHSNRSCKTYSLGQYDIKRWVTENTGKPGLIIEADMTDFRKYSEGQIKEQIQNFIELLG